MHVLLAMDGSKESMAAVEVLSKLPFPEKPLLTVVTALADSPYDLVTTDRGDWLQETEQTNANEYFEQAKGILTPHFSQIEYLVEHQHPNKLIIETAKRQNVDLIVLGARGHTAVYRVMLGSTADYVATHAHCSVLIVRSFSDGSYPDFSGPYNIFLAYDGSEGSKEACHQMCSMKWPENARVHISMVLERPKLLPDEVVYDPPQIEASENSLRVIEELNDLPCQAVRSVHESIHVGSSIQTTAEDENSHVLFIGGTGKSAIARFFLGSASHFVLHHAHCPIWLARKKTWN